jgi:drug/metabolite transporter (DMT)-like permease
MTSILLVRACLNHSGNKMFPEVNLKIGFLYFVMSFFSICGFVIFLHGLQSMKLANAISLKYTEQVLWIISGIVFMKESVSLYQWKYIFLSVIGILLIMLNTTQESNMNVYCFPILAAIFWTISSQLGKFLVLRKTDIFNHMFLYYAFHLVIIIYLSLYFGIFNQSWGIKHIIAPSYEFLIQAFSMIFFYKAMEHCYISLLAPFIYIKLVIAAAIGFFLFGEQPSYTELVSYVLIMFSGIKLFYNKTAVINLS